MFDISLAQTRLPIRVHRVIPFIMDHAQGRAFHHHLARAIMHLNYLAGLLPFFEPSIEWEDPSNEHDPRSGRSNPASRNLHTFVPLPVSSTPPTMISHGSIPTRMVLNPEPNLRPLTIAHHPREDEGHRNVEATARNPTSIVGHPSTPVLETHKWGRPVPDFPRTTTRTTTPVPVRSKQRSNPVDDPQPKKKQRSTLSAPESTARPPPLHIIAEIPPNGFNSDDSDEDAASDDHNLANEHSTTPPPGTSSPIEPTPNPTIRILQPADSARGHGSAPFRPWTDIEDQELINLKNDTKSRPSWKSIGARLRRDPQTCKLRWAILKQMSDQRLIMNRRQRTKSLRQKKERILQHSQ